MALRPRTAEVRLQYITDAPSGLPSADYAGGGGVLSWRAGAGQGSSSAIHHGQDYYNLGFAEKITRLQFGFTLQRDQFLSFRIKP